MTLHIRNVSNAYSNGVQALKDVTLTIQAGLNQKGEGRRRTFQ